MPNSEKEVHPCTNKSCDLHTSDSPVKDTWGESNCMLYYCDELEKCPTYISKPVIN